MTACACSRFFANSGFIRRLGSSIREQFRCTRHDPIAGFGNVEQSLEQLLFLIPIWQNVRNILGDSPESVVCTIRLSEMLLQFFPLATLPINARTLKSVDHGAVANLSHELFVFLA